MDVEGLGTFLAVLRAGGFSGAARSLGRTQPAITRRIQILEQELGAPVFERGPGAPRLTQAGVVLVPHAERAIATLEDAKAAVRALASEDKGPLSVAIVGTLAGTGLTATLKAFRAAHPEVQLSLSTATSAEVSDLVRRGEVTIGLRYFEDRSDDLSSMKLFDERLVVACATSHRLARRTAASLSQLKNESWFEFPAVPGRRETAAQSLLVQFRTRGIGNVAWMAVDSLTAQKRLVEADFGLALLPESAIGEELAAKTLAVIHVKDLQAVNPVHAVARKNGYLSAAARRLLEILQSGARRGRRTS